MSTLQEWIEQNSSMIEALRKQENLFRQAMSPAVQSYVFSINTLAKSGAFEAFQQNNQLSEINTSLKHYKQEISMATSARELIFQTQGLSTHPYLQDILDDTKSAFSAHNYSPEEIQDFISYTNKFIDKEDSSSKKETAVTDKTIYSDITKAEVCKNIIDVIRDLLPYIAPGILIPEDAEKVLTCIAVLMTLYITVNLVNPTKQSKNP